MKQARPRRSGDDAREAILVAAERRLRKGGVAALRLQEVAQDVGISHPAILHHFKSREGLVKAVVEHATVALQKDLLRALRPVGGRPIEGVALLERVAETLFQGGHARLIAWLLLAGYDPFDSEDVRAGWSSIIQYTHARRLEEVEGPTKPTYEDTLFTVILSSLALFGEAIAGRTSFDAAGLADDRAAPRRFREWLAKLLGAHLTAPAG